MNLVSHPTRPHIERIVLSAGGAKGPAYLGVYKAVCDLTSPKYFAGASAGAIIAIFYAIGISFKKLREEFINTDFSELLGDRVGSFCGNETGVCWITKDGKPLKKLLRKIIRESITDFFDSKEGVKVRSQEENIAEIFERSTQGEFKFTFADLYALQRCSKRFKKLIMFGVETNGAECPLNFKETPHLEIAKACRASAAIPLILTPEKVKINGKERLIIDGGIRDQLPRDYFDKDPNGHGYLKNQKISKTLLFSFSDHANVEKSSPYKAIYTQENPIYDPNCIEKWVRDYAPSLLGSFEGDYTNSERWNAVFQDMRQFYSENTVILNVGEVQAYEYEKGTRLSREMAAAGFFDAFFYITENFAYNENYPLHKFHSYFVLNFSRIYWALKVEAEEDINQDEFWVGLQDYKQIFQEEALSRQERAKSICHYIRRASQNALGSYVGFALSRAWEYMQEILDFDTLVTEIQVRSKNKNDTDTGLDLSLFCGSCCSSGQEVLLTDVSNYGSTFNIALTPQMLKKIKETY